MSLASIFVQQITGDYTAEHKVNLIDGLLYWKNPEVPFESMGVIIKGKEKEVFVKEIKERLWQYMNSEESRIEDWFWMYYISDVLEFKIEANNKKKKLAKFFYTKCESQAYFGIEEYISAMRLI